MNDSKEDIFKLDFSLRGKPRNLLNAAHSNFRTVHAEKKKWKNAVANICLSRRPSKPLEQAAIVFIRYGSRKMDYDNLVAIAKPVFDGLVLGQIIENDTSDVVIFREYKQEFASRGEERIRVIVSSEWKTCNLCGFKSLTYTL